MNTIIDKTLHFWCNRKHKRTGGGWISANAVCCHHRGHRVDTRMRGGLIVTGDDKINYSCFNCNFKCGYSTGKLLSDHFRKLLSWMGMSDDEVAALSMEALRLRDTSLLVKTKVQHELIFKDIALPKDAEIINPNNPQHIRFVNILTARGFMYDDYQFMVTPKGEGRDAHRIIIPYFLSGRTVGYTSRYYDDIKPKYISEQQSGYVFNLDRQDPSWEICILVEGQFDALAIGGCAIMSNEVSEKQSWLISKLKRRIIYVPDRDLAGFKGIERALDYGYSVSIPPTWDSTIKDVNDAVLKYGKLATLLSIIQHATISKAKIKIYKDKVL